MATSTLIGPTTTTTLRRPARASAPWVFAATILVVGGCSGSEPDTSNVPVCGDGVRNGSDQCEGGDLGGETCKTQGFAGGRLLCFPDCTFDTSECSQTCGNGAIDPGEQCDTTNFNGEVCSSWGVLLCDEVCKLDRSHCVPSLLEERQRLDFRGPAFIALGPRKDGKLVWTELFATQSADHRIDILKYASDTGFQATSPRTIGLDDTQTALEPAVADLNGDGSADVALVYAGLRTLDLRLSNGAASGYAKTLVDLGCAPPSDAEALAGGAIWAADLDGDGRLDLAVACATAPETAIDSIVLVHNSASGFAKAATVTLGTAAKHVRLARASSSGPWQLLVGRPGTSAVAVFEGQSGALGFTDSGRVVAEGEVPGDFVAFDANADGALDLVAVQPTGLSLLLSQGGGAPGSAQPIAGAPAGVVRLQALEVDGDGFADLAALTESTLVILRGAAGGGGFGTATTQSLAIGFQARGFAFGDLEGDGDLDAAVTGSGSGGKVVVYRNAVR